jgi:hypothetical protein
MPVLPLEDDVMDPKNATASFLTKLGQGENVPVLNTPAEEVS